MGWVFDGISSTLKYDWKYNLNSQMMARKMSRIYIFLEYPTDIPYISHIYPTSWDVL